MTGRSVLLTPGTMGPAEWSDVARRLAGHGHRVVVDDDLAYDRGVLAAAGTQVDRLRDARFWTSEHVDRVDLAVGFDVGAGPAATMVAEGRATSAVLIDPDLTMLATSHPDDLEVLAPGTGFELALEIAERLEPFGENLRHGPLTREVVDIMCGTFTGEAWRLERADLVAPFLMNRLAVDRSQVATEDDRRAADWSAVASGTAVTIWLSAGSEVLAGYLRGQGFEVVVSSWAEVPWIRSAEELSVAIDDELQMHGVRS